MNEDDIAKNAKLDSIKKYTTPSGFVYPAPKDPSEIVSTQDKLVNRDRRS